MAYHHRPPASGQSQSRGSPQRTSPPPYGKNYSPTQTSPLRHHASTASTNSSAYSGSSDPFAPSRTSTISSAASSGYENGHYYHAPHAAGSLGQKRDLARAGMATGHRYNKSSDGSDPGAFKSMRQSLRPLPQPPADTSHNAPPPPPPSHHRRHESVPDDSWRTAQPLDPSIQRRPLPPTQRDPSRPSPTPPSHGESHYSRLHSSLPPLSSQASDPPSSPNGVHTDHSHAGPRAAVLAQPDLSELKKSSTGYLRTLSRLASDEPSTDFNMSTAGPSVAGLHNRRQLKRSDSVRGAGNGRAGVAPTTDSGLGFAGRNWMDAQRQFLQAYEYLCHIGEAKEWIEDVIHKPIPPIVELEQALRDGVTLAEVVQALQPQRPVRIFRHERLQYRHSDNIGVFFRFVAEVELPELFRFELVDLYERKNIPKVIYCIHALSWLLYRNGTVGFRIGNLVGQLQFEHHELEEVQKGLDRSGVSMPSFAGMGASFGAEPEPEPEPEPVETEEDRIRRELGALGPVVVDLQSQIRGATTRLGLGSTMQRLWDAEPGLARLQARLRGDWARQIFAYRLSMRHFAVNLQSAARGYVVRNGAVRREMQYRALEPKVLLLQSVVRAKRAREQQRFINTRVQSHDEGVRRFQAAVRGALQRKAVGDTYYEAQHEQVGVAKMQAAIRSVLERQRFQRQKAELRQASKTVMRFQARIRATAGRRAVQEQQQSLQSYAGLYRALQAVSRGAMARQRYEGLRNELATHRSLVKSLQALVRGSKTRQDVDATQRALRATSSGAVALQAASRAFMLRKRNATDLSALRDCQPQFVKLQSVIRAVLFRRSHLALLYNLESHVHEIIALQGLSRAMLLRVQVGDTLSQLDEAEPSVELLQSAVRGCLVRARFAEKKRYFKQNMEKVVKLQSFVRARQQGQAYKSLTSGANPPVGTVKNFVHLLNDSDFDLNEEVESEQLRKTVVQHVRQNELAEQYISQLDVKIALLVKNKITLDEVLRHHKGFGSIGTLVRGNAATADPIGRDSLDLKALNKDSRKRLDLYQELFFLLQTQPAYLSRWFRLLRERATPEKECERHKHMTMGIFGYAQKHREEYHLLRLLARAVREEVAGCAQLADFQRGNFFWARVFGAYTKTPRDRRYLRDLLAPVLREHILDNPELDLESDPLNIYHAILNDEQLRTGQQPARSPDLTREQAIRDPDTRAAFVRHMQDLRDVADHVQAQLEETLARLPYGVRYCAQQAFQALTAHFPREDPGALLLAVGHWAWRAYLAPALAEPETHGVLDRALAPEQRKNMAEVTRVLSQCCAGRLFGQGDPFMLPLNPYVTESMARLKELWSQVIDVPDPETQFDMDEYNDLYAKTKPTLYVKMADIFAVHRLIAADVAQICPDHDDVLRAVVRELGSAQRNESELAGVGSSEICLTLNPKLHNVEDPDAEVKTLFMETKRCILYIIRVQAGPDLLAILVQPITPADEARWQELVHTELRASSAVRPPQRTAYADHPSPLADLTHLSYAELKGAALEHVLALEQAGRLSRHNRYQDLLNAIALDIRTKHRRRTTRAREIAATRLTLARLREQSTYLDTRLRAYNDYVEQAMATLQKGGSSSGGGGGGGADAGGRGRRRRFVLPFTKQWEHERELARSGRVPRFGSWKYAASELASRGVLVSWRGRAPGGWHRLDLTLASNEVGAFSVEASSGSVGLPGASAVVTLDELLQAQWNGTPFVDLFDEAERARFEVGNLMGLIMRKFYKDRDG